MKLLSILLLLVLTVTLVMTGCVEIDSDSSDQTIKQTEVIKKPEVTKQPEVSEQAKIVAEIYLNLFEATSATSTILGNIPEGEVLETLETRGKWNKVETSSGKQGWVYMFTARDRFDFIDSLYDGRIDEVERWLDMGMSMYAPYPGDHALLGIFSRTSDLSEMKIMLINRGAEVNVKDDRGYTPLHLAAWYCKRNNPEVVKRLIGAGAEVNNIVVAHSGEHREVYTPLNGLESKLAYAKGKERERCSEIKRMLLEAGADPTITRKDPRYLGK